MGKKAFTLAEVLITLGILGVIAAITIPALLTNVEKTQFEGGLKAAQNILSNGFAEMKAAEMADTLRDTALYNCFSNTVSSVNVNEHSCILENMKKYFAITDYQNGLPSGVTVYDIQGGDKSDSQGLLSGWFGDTIRYTFSNGMTANMVFVSSSVDKSRADCQSIKDNGGSMCGLASYIFIDVNGNKKPNIVGKDIYEFLLGTDGRLYPWGGKDSVLYGLASSWKTKCSGKPLSDQCKADASFTLTGRVVEEGNRITYY